VVGIPALNPLLARSATLHDVLAGFLGLSLHHPGPRARISRLICGISYEHAESVKILIAAGNFTSAAGLMRLQYEAVVRALWAFYAATDGFVDKLSASLTEETARKAASLPMVGEMLESLDAKAPKEALGMLIEFRDHQWKPLSSFVHGGLHAIHRHETGYPFPLMHGALRSSNGLLIMAAMLLVILHGGKDQVGKIPAIQIEFDDALPPRKAQNPKTPVFE
jgi:hypothetical protein